MYNHEASLVNESICISLEKHTEVGKKIEKILNETDSPNNVSKTIQELVKYMGSGEDLDITKSVIAHLLMNLFQARIDNHPMKALARLLED